MRLLLFSLEKDMNDEQNSPADDRLADQITARRGRKPKAESATLPVEPDEDAIAESVVNIRTVKPEAKRLVSVVLKRNYHPVNDFTINGESPSGEQRTKIFAGAVIEMDRAEAKSCYERGIVIPHDPFG